jgi:hypothetical protein
MGVKIIDLPLTPMARKLKRDRTPYLYVVGEKLLPINSHHLVNIKPKTANQSLAFQSYADGYHLVMAGAAGCGKSFLAMYFALRDALDPSTRGVREGWEPRRFIARGKADSCDLSRLQYSYI